MLDAALTLFVALGLLSVVIGIIGFFAAFTDTGFGVLVDDLFLHLADIAIGVLAIVWALGEIATLKSAAPGAGEPGTVEAGQAPPLTPPAGSWTSSPTTMRPYAPPPAPPTTTLPTVPPPTMPPPVGATSLWATSVWATSVWATSIGAAAGTARPTGPLAR